MKQAVVVALFAVILAGCSPQKRLARLLERYPIPIDTIRVDTMTIYRDSAVRIYLPGDTAWKAVFIELPKPVYPMDTAISVETDYARAEAGVVVDSLWLRLEQTDTLVVYTLDSVIVEKEVEKEIIKTVTVKEKPNPFWRNGFLILAVLFVLALVLLIVFRK